jgi:hypothetical protein
MKPLAPLLEFQPQDRVETARSETDPGRTQPKLLEQELVPAVLEHCRFLSEEYASLARTAPAAFPFEDRDLLAWYAELKYKLSGGGHCTICRAHVRHAVPVTSERADNITVIYACLCTRCLVAEEAISRRVTLAHEVEADGVRELALPAAA